MILLADSGSTKTNWRLTGKSNVMKEIKGPGLNPNYQSAEQIHSELRKLKSQLGDVAIDTIYFYGTGCGNEKNRGIVQNQLNQLFPGIEIRVSHDLLAAARALFHQESGIACILGTGSNCGYYDGSTITHNIPSLGYLLGDEGSGMKLGSALLRAYFRKTLPLELNLKFEEQHPISMPDVLNAIHSKQFPNRYIAAFAHFIKKNIDHEFLQHLVFYEFDELVKRCLLKCLTDQARVGFVGSIAYNFSDILTKVCDAHNIDTYKIVTDPIDSLVDYHLGHL